MRNIKKMTLTPFRGFIRLIIYSLVLISLAGWTGCPVKQYYQQGNIEKMIDELEELAKRCGATEEQIKGASAAYSKRGEESSAIRAAREACKDPNAACATDEAVRAAAYAGVLRSVFAALLKNQNRATEAGKALEGAETALQASKTAAMAAAEAVLDAQQFQGFGDGRSQITAAEINAINAGADTGIAKAAAAAAITPNTHDAAKQVALDRGYSEDEARVVSNAISVGPDLAEAVEAVGKADRTLNNARASAYTAALPAGPGITNEQASAVADAVVERIRRMMTPDDTINQVPRTQRVDDIRGAGTTGAFEAGVRPSWVQEEAGFFAGNAAKGVLRRAGFDLVSGDGWPTEAWQKVQDARRVAAAAAVREGIDEDAARALAQSAVNAKVEAYRQAETNATEAALSTMRQRVQTTLDINRRATDAASDAYLQALREGKSADEAKSGAYDAAEAAGAAGNIATDIAEALRDQIGDDTNASRGQTDQVAREATPNWDWDDDDWARWEDRARVEAEAYGRSAALGAAERGADIDREDLTGPGIALTQEFERKVNALGRAAKLSLTGARSAAHQADSAWFSLKNRHPEVKVPTVQHRGENYGHRELGIYYNTLIDHARALASSKKIQVVHPIDKFGGEAFDWGTAVVHIIAGANDAKEIAYKLLQASERLRDRIEQEAIYLQQETNKIAALVENYANEKLEQVSRECGGMQMPPGRQQVDLPGFPIGENASGEIEQNFNISGVDFFSTNPTGETATFSDTYKGDFTLVSDPIFVDGDFGLRNFNPHSIIVVNSIVISGTTPFFVGAGSFPGEPNAKGTVSGITFTNNGGTLAFTYTVNSPANGGDVTYTFKGVK